MPVVLKAAQILRSKGDEIPIMVGVLDPLNIAFQLRGAESFLMDLLLHPEDCHRLLDICEDATLDIRALQDVSDVITIIDTTSSPDLLSPNDFRTLSRPCLKTLVKKSETPCILLIYGRAHPILEDVASVGAKAISVDSCVDIGISKAVARGCCAVAGNVSTIGSLLLGTPKEVDEETKTAIEKGSDISCTSCGIAPNPPTENLKAMVSAIHLHGRRMRE